MDYRGAPKPEEWKAIDYGSEYAASFLWTRLEWLMDYDPHLTMFTKDVRQSICRIVLDALGDGEGHIVVTTNHEVFAYVMDGIDRSPLGGVAHHTFKVHLITLVMTAVQSGNVKNGMLT